MRIKLAGKPDHPKEVDAYCKKCGQMRPHLMTQYDNAQLYWCYEFCGCAFTVAVKKGELNV